MPASIIMNATSTLTEGTSQDAVQLSSPLTVSFNGSASQMQPLDIILKPMQTQSLIQAPPTLTYTTSTNWSVSYPLAADGSTARLSAAPGTFRGLRALAMSPSSVVSVIRLSDTVARIVLTTSPWSTTDVQIGDQLFIERTTDSFTSPFATANQGLFLTVVGKSSTSIDIADNGVLVPDPSVSLNAQYATAIKVLTSNVLPNDVLYVYSSLFGYANKGKFVITTASDSYVEFINSSATAETVTTVQAGGILVGRNVAQYLFLTASSSVEILLVNQAVGGGVLVSPETGSNAIALLTLSTPVLSLHNPSLTDDIRIVAHVALSSASGC